MKYIILTSKGNEVTTNGRQQSYQGDDQERDRELPQAQQIGQAAGDLFHTRYDRSQTEQVRLTDSGTALIYDVMRQIF